ncbi:MAG: N-formylglutamate amidohydrolase [Oscillospiraceae bacterium]|nr:N-formylglutamate amidohydrolase [Oscillospiraceae bacterium]
MKKIVLHIPHSSKVIPHEYKKEFLLSESQLEEELLCMTDAYTDILFPQEYERVVFPISRLVCDPERFRDDSKEPMSQKGMGVIYTKGSKGQLIRKTQNREAIVARYYDSHHYGLNNAVKTALDETDSCLILDCHSFSGEPLPYEDDQLTDCPDFCIGTDAFHTPQKLTEAAIRFFKDRDYSVDVNRPYSGSIVPMAFYKADRRVSSIMIEINRSLYMDDSGNRTKGFKEIQNALSDCCRLLSTL